MVETDLTAALVEEGAELIRKLDRSGRSPDAALWLYSPSLGGWKLLLVEAKVGREGPRESYKGVQKALNSLGDKIRHISLEDVALARPDSKLVRLLLRAISTGQGDSLSGIRFTRNVIDGTLIEDAYIYRMRRPAA